MMDTRAYWIAPEGSLLPVPLSHINMVIRDPERFGLTTQEIKAAYRKHNEPVGLEGKAREHIIISLLGRGWIRTRVYRQYLAVQLLDLEQYGSRDRLRVFFGSQRIAYPADMEVRLSLFKSGQMKRFKFGNIEAELMG